MGFIIVKKIMPSAQIPASFKSPMDAVDRGISFSSSSGAMYTTVPRSTLLFFEASTVRVWISRERLPPKSVSLHATGLD